MWIGFMMGAAMVGVFWKLLQHMSHFAEEEDVTAPRALIGTALAALLIVLASRVERLVTPLSVIMNLDLERARNKRPTGDADDRVVNLVTRLLTIVQGKSPPTTGGG